MPKPVDDTIRITEAGHLFEVFGPAVDGSRAIAVSRDGAVVDGGEAADWAGACAFVERWLDRHVPADAPGRFAGFRYRKWEHEGGCVGEGAVLTRRALMELYEDGTMPTPAEFANLLEACGDRVLELRDGDGNLLLDRRAEVKDFLVRLHAEDYAFLDEPMESAATPAP